jgi:rod shape-determining protein MreD
MRWIRIGLYVLLILVLQTVVFARLNFWGAVPDLVLVSVIIFAILDKNQKSTLFAAGSSFLQDILGYGIYINTITKVLVSSLTSIIKESFIGDEYSLAALLVAVFTPLTLTVEGLILYLFFDTQFEAYAFVITVLITTVYNLIMVPVFLPVIRKLSRD